MHATFARWVFRRLRLGRALVPAVAFLILIAAPAGAADLGDAEALYRTGRYDECTRMVDAELENGGWTEPWRVLKIKSALARGKDADALTAVEDALRRFPFSLPLRLMARDVYRFNNRDAEALGELNEIERLVAGSVRRYSTPEGLVALGRFFLIKGADARKVLDQCYDIVTKQQPDFVEAHLATAELALEKDDDALAAETLRKAPKAARLEPHYHYLMARALASEERSGAIQELTEALKINPFHVDSLLLQVDLAIDAEKYADAELIIKKILAINPREQQAWAYRAVLAHIQNDGSAETSARKSALDRWAANPEVDYLVGRKLSQKYRFAEGAARQRQALALDPSYLPAQLQLCQDLLRLGDEAGGWKLAAEIFGRDGYNVVAFNLITLRDRLAGFRTLEADGFVLRMDPREADLYGHRVLALLGRAKRVLCAKYAVSLSEPVIVEIFPRRKEFAVRTFGLPGADGLLGVCFGRVITANSPASQGEHPSNWEAVLWHEFCHVVTLSKTHNKMPRWLSEGISVYEESCEQPAWGMAFQPKFREMILSEAFTPLSGLSSAFLTAKSALQLQFAYYESALAVEFLARNFGLPALLELLDDLGAGLTANDSLPRRMKKTLEEIDRDFAAFARARAEHIAANATWDEPELPAAASSAAISAWLDQHPKSFPGWKRLGAQQVKEERWQQAKVTLQKVKMLYPEYVGADNAYLLLGEVYHHLGDSAAERQILEDLALRDGDASPAYLRLMAIDEAAGDWNGVVKNARRMLAVNPLIPAPHRALARAAEQLGDRETAISSYRSQAMLDETDPAELHYRLARLLHERGDSTAARREILKSLEEAPRFAAAHQLLLELHSRKPGASPTDAGNNAAQGAKP
jgi:uncharacterized protein HemY